VRDFWIIRALVPSVLAMMVATVDVAGAAVINFDTLADSTPVTTQFAGLTFSNATVLTEGISLNEFEFPPKSPPNVAFDDGGVITIVFDALQASVGGFFTYLVPVTLTAYDAALNPIAVDVSDFSSNAGLSGDPGSSPNELLEVVSALGIARVTIVGDPSGASFTLDDLTSVDRPATQTPAPATGALLGLGLILCNALHVARRVGRFRARP
jgi:hypothetical protein